MPLWSIGALVSGLVLLASSAALLAASVRIARRRAGCCPECGFDLGEIHSGRCPECSCGVQNGRRGWPWQRPGNMFFRIGALGALVSVCLILAFAASTQGMTKREFDGLLIILLPSAFVALVGMMMRVIRKRTGCCPECGYSLRGLRSNRCPECGGWITGRTFNPWESPGQFIQWLGVIPIVLLACITSLQLAYSLSQDHPPDPPPDTTPPTLEVSFIGFDDEILFQSPTEIRVKPGTELINTTRARDDRAGRTIWHITFQDVKYDLGSGRLTAPMTPGTYTARAYARDAAGNETTQEYRIVVVVDDDAGA